MKAPPANVKESFLRLANNPDYQIITSYLNDMLILNDKKLRHIQGDTELRMKQGWSQFMEYFLDCSK